jgi:hypothetical protein
MRLIDRKTQKAIEKTLRKAIRQHGPAIAAGLASGLASIVATLASTDAPRRRGKSNLGVLLERIQAAVADQSENVSGKQRAGKKARRRRGILPPREAPAA